MKAKLAVVSIAAALHLTMPAGAEAQEAHAAASASTVAAVSPRTDSKMAYHGGPVMKGVPYLYLVWYGCWGVGDCADTVSQFDGWATAQILTDFVSTLGSTPYFQINAGYPDTTGVAPSGALFYDGAALDRYSRGATLTQADLPAIITDQILAGVLPLNPDGIYVVLTSSDVALVDGSTQFCLTCCDLHGHSVLNYTEFRYAFVGNPRRCPTACASQFANQPSPNGNYAADAMASWLAHALNETLTNPHGDAWYDRYGLENAEKCEGTYGATETVTNPDGDPAEVNIKLGDRYFLLQQNWVNSKKAPCGMTR